MSISLITGFDISKSVPADVKEVVANQAGRLAIVYPYTGLSVYELDTKKIYVYKTTTPVDGSIPSNVSGDWERKIQVYTGTGIPSNANGANDDIYIEEAGSGLYKKVGGVWTSLFSMTGAQILYGSGVPSNGSGANNDSYIDTATGNLYKKSGGVWTLQMNILGADGADGQSDQYATTSATSIDLATAAAPLNLTVGLDLSYTAGQPVIVASRANNVNNIVGNVVSYNVGTGTLVLNTLTISGTGTFTDWDVNLTGIPGAIGKAFVHLESDINLSDAKVTSVEAGSYTPQDPYTASVANDTRAIKTVPLALVGGGVGVAGNSIAYDGTTWFDNGKWRGPAGAQGAQGPQGIQGTQGIQGVQGNTGLIPYSNLAVPGSYPGLAYGYYICNLIGGAVAAPLTLSAGTYYDGTFIFVQTTGISPTGATISFTGGVTCWYRGQSVTSIAVAGSTGVQGLVLAYRTGAWIVVSESIIPSVTVGDFDAGVRMGTSGLSIVATLINSALTPPVYPGTAAQINVVDFKSLSNNSVYDNNWYYVMPNILAGSASKSTNYLVHVEFVLGNTTGTAPDWDISIQFSTDPAFGTFTTLKNILGESQLSRTMFNIPVAFTVPAGQTGYLRTRINLQGGVNWIISNKAIYTHVHLPNIVN